ncbi:MAG: Gfo/Idh/MocA family oxidoreductase [Phycisphaerae bacterium]|nr:Gfo/Idh/MocA family oxidoreductase [Phycisphaerae bacterium]
MKTIRFGIIGAGLMGREFASAAARWCHLKDMPTRPELVAVCDTNVALRAWYSEHFATVTQSTDDYRELLANPNVDAVYVALPHNLHQEVYCAAIDAGKHLMGEKPFGIDRAANESILAAARRNPKTFVRCSSEFPFYPAVQQIGRMIESGELGTIIEAETGFLHSSDMDPDKPVNWKRTIEANGEYGVMGDLGMHACHVPFRAGWQPKNVRAILSDIVPQRPDGQGGMAPCRTWDNATLLCETLDPVTQATFPWTLRTYRIAPGEKNTWYVRILGTRTSVRFSTKNPRRLDVLRYSPGDEQAWQQIDTGAETAYPVLTGGIFECGFTDIILQMWAAYCYELHHGKPISRFAGCVTPDEVAMSHALFTAALVSHKTTAAVEVRADD